MKNIKERQFQNKNFNRTEEVPKDIEMNLNDEKPNGSCITDLEKFEKTEPSENKPNKVKPEELKPDEDQHDYSPSSNYLDELNDFETKYIEEEYQKNESSEQPEVPHLSLESGIIKPFNHFLEAIAKKTSNSVALQNDNIFIKAVDGVVSFIYDKESFYIEIRTPTITFNNNKVLKDLLIVNLNYLTHLLKNSEANNLTIKKDNDLITMDLGSISDFPIDDYYVDIEKYENACKLFAKRKEFEEKFAKLDRSTFTKFCINSSKMMHLSRTIEKNPPHITIEGEQAYFKMNNQTIIKIENAGIKERISLSLDSIDKLKNLLLALNKIEKFYKKQKLSKNDKDTLGINYYILDDDKIMFNSKYFTLILPLQYTNDNELEEIKSRFYDQSIKDSVLIHGTSLINDILRLTTDNMYFMQGITLYNKEKHLCLKAKTQSNKEFSLDLNNTNFFLDFDKIFPNKNLLVVFQIVRNFCNEDQQGYMYIDNNKDIIFANVLKSNEDDINVKVIMAA